MVALTIPLHNFTPATAAVERVRAMFTGGQINAAVEISVTGAVKKRLLQHGQKQNRLGAPSTNFWLRASDSVETESTGTAAGGTVIIRITQRGVALHLHGGTVRPKGTSEITGKPIRFLTIPKVAQAHGKTVAMLRALGVDLYPGRGGLLRQTGPQRDSEGDEMWFVLARSATIKADATVVPSEAALAAAGTEAILELFDAAGA